MWKMKKNSGAMFWLKFREITVFINESKCKLISRIIFCKSEFLFFPHCVHVNVHLSFLTWLYSTFEYFVSVLSIHYHLLHTKTSKSPFRTYIYERYDIYINEKIILIYTLIVLNDDNESTRWNVFTHQK